MTLTFDLRSWIVLLIKIFFRHEYLRQTIRIFTSIDEILPLQLASATNLSYTWIWWATFMLNSTSSMTSSPWNISGIIWDDLLISDVQLTLFLIFWHFQNGCHFEVATKLITGSKDRGWIYQRHSYAHFRYFEVFIDAIAKILVEIWQFKVLGLFWNLMTSSMISWIRIYISIATIPDTYVQQVVWWYPCSLLVIIKAVLFHL